MSDDEILYEKSASGVATITLNRAEKLNAFTHTMITKWADMLDEASRDPDVRVVLITGRGRAFCAGGDMDEMGDRAKHLDALGKKNFLWKHVHKLALAKERMDKPVIAALNGQARGAGCDMALMCDMRIAAESASFTWSYIKLGLVAGDGGAWFLPRLIGMPRALELLLTGRTVGSAEADRIGLVNRVVPDAELHQVAMSLAEEIASQPREAVHFYMRSAYQGQSQTLYNHLDMISSHMAVLRETKDHISRVEAFREARRNARKTK